MWHRSPEGGWTFIQDAPPKLACTRYFGSAVSHHLKSGINLTWSDPWNFSVDISGDYEVHWQVSLEDNFTSRLLNSLGGLIPDALWRQRLFLKSLQSLGSRLMGSGRLSLTGQLPNGQWFVTQPRYMWNVAATPRPGPGFGRHGPLGRTGPVGRFLGPAAGQVFHRPGLFGEFRSEPPPDGLFSRGLKNYR